MKITKNNLFLFLITILVLAYTSWIVINKFEGWLPIFFFYFIVAILYYQVSVSDRYSTNPEEFVRDKMPGEVPNGIPTMGELTRTTIYTGLSCHVCNDSPCSCMARIEEEED